jgi:aspartate/methionine/tyrosine aminotransferase
MADFQPFVMERWQSTWENRVAHNLSESGVHPLTLGELLALAGGADIGDTPVGYGQSNGTEPLRAAIAALYDGTPGIDGISVTNGSAEANFVALWELLEEGDEVVILAPTYMQAQGLAESFGAAVRTVRLREQHGWQPDPAEIRTAVTDRTKVIVVTNPANPTGSILCDEAVDAVVQAAARTGAWILADEVYAGAELDGRPTPSLLGRHDRVIATGSLSKAYGLPGLRIGWAATDPATAERLWARTDYTTISPGALTDRLALLALDPAVRPRLLERTRSIICDGLGILEGWLIEQGVFRWQPPRAGAILYARYDLPIGSEDLAERLREEYGVLIVSGAHFAMDKYLRFGFGLEPVELRAALDRMGECIARVRQDAPLSAH